MDWFRDVPPIQRPMLELNSGCSSFCDQVGQEGGDRIRPQLLCSILPFIINLSRNLLSKRILNISRNKEHIQGFAYQKIILKPSVEPFGLFYLLICHVSTSSPNIEKFSCVSDCVWISWLSGMPCPPGCGDIQQIRSDTHKHGAEVQQHKHHTKNLSDEAVSAARTKNLQEATEYYRHIGLIDILGLIET